MTPPLDFYVEVARNPAERSVDVYVTSHNGKEIHFLHDGVLSPLAEGERYPEPTFRLVDDIGPKLLQELLRFYNGADDARTLRRDYDAERARVDTLIRTVGRIAEGKLA